MSYCVRCGAELKEGDAFCAKCGAAQGVEATQTSRSEVSQANVQNATKTTDVFAIAALALSILGFLTGFLKVGMALDVIAIVFAALSLRKSKKGNLPRKGIAVAGLIIATVSLILCAFLFGKSMISSIADLGKKPLIETKGFFVLNRKSDDIFAANNELTSKETYLIHVYDVQPHSSKNINMDQFESSYTILLNKTNKYVPLAAREMTISFNSDYYKNIDRFVCGSGYAALPEVGTIPAGSDTFRAMSVYKINTNDLNDNLSGVFEITGSEEYDCELKFSKKDITYIDELDDVFQIENNPSDYRMAAAYLRRVDDIESWILITRKSLVNVSDEALNAFANSADISEYYLKDAAFSVTGIDISKPAFSVEAVKRVYPDLPVDRFEDAATRIIDSMITWAASVKNGGYDETAANQVESGVKTIPGIAQEIADYYNDLTKNK